MVKRKSSVNQQSQAAPAKRGRRDQRADPENTENVSPIKRTKNFGGFVFAATHFESVLCTQVQASPSNGILLFNVDFMAVVVLFLLLRHGELGWRRIQHTVATSSSQPTTLVAAGSDTKPFTA